MRAMPAGPGFLGKLVFEMDIPVVYACREGPAEALSREKARGASRYCGRI